MSTTEADDAFLLYQHEEYIYTRMSIQCVVSILGFAFNVLAIVVILTKEHPVSTQNRLVLNLCGVNVVTCGVILPVHTYDLHLRVSNDWGIFCDIMGYLLNYAQVAGLLAYLHITLHRYFIIVFMNNPNIGYGSLRKTVIIVVFVTILPGLLMFPALFHIWGKFGMEPSYGTCNLLTGQGGGSNSFNYFGQALAIGVPLFTMIYSYSHIIYVVRRQKCRINVAQAISQNASGEPTMIKKPRKRRHQDLQLTKATVLIIAVFFVSFLPYLIAEQTPALDDNVIVKSISAPLLIMHAVTDPVIYVAYDSKLREHLVSLVKCSAVRA